MFLGVATELVFVGLHLSKLALQMEISDGLWMNLTLSISPPSSASPVRVIQFMFQFFLKESSQKLPRSQIFRRKNVALICFV